MSVRLEWITAHAAGAELVDPGDPAPDGQTCEYGGYTLVIGHGDSYGAAIEGSKEELLDFLDRCTRAVQGSP